MCDLSLYENVEKTRNSCFLIESSAKFAGTGCPGACQSCGKTKVDLVFDDVETTRLVGIKCLHMKGIGRRCAWGKEITAENKA